MPKAGSTEEIKKGSTDKTANLVRDTEIEVKDNGQVWRRYSEVENAILATDKKVVRDEL